MQSKLSEQGQQISSLTAKNRDYSALIAQHETIQEVRKNPEKENLHF
jgi:hypothetical protein